MKIALLCSGLGNISRGHEIFARDLFELIKDSVDITIFKGGGNSAPNEVLIDNVNRTSPFLDNIHVAVSPRWVSAAQEQERIQVEAETFAYATLKLLLEGEFDVIHCLEQEVCNVIYSKRHLFAKTPKIVFSNGGAIRAPELPLCDFVQEHTDFNLSRSDKHKAFMIPHGIDLTLFNPDITSDFRASHGIPESAFVVISVGTICYWHKRMDYVIKEVSPLQDVYLVIVGQECGDTPEIIGLGKKLMGDRVIFTKMSHDDLPKAYAAADVFVLGSLFETFGIVYIEAMAMELPVICTNHLNQRAIVKEGIFIDMMKDGALTSALRDLDRSEIIILGKKGRKIAKEYYDLNKLKQRYIEQYKFIASSPAMLPKYSFKLRLMSNIRNSFRRLARAF